MWGQTSNRSLDTTVMVGHSQNCNLQLIAGNRAGKGKGRGRGRGRGRSHIYAKQATMRRGNNEAHKLIKVDATKVSKVVDEDADWEDV